jgi:hypothetical protein
VQMWGYLQSSQTSIAGQFSRLAEMVHRAESDFLAHPIARGRDGGATLKSPTSYPNPGLTLCEEVLTLEGVLRSAEPSILGRVS